MFTSTSGMRTSNGISRSNSTSSKQSDNQSQSEIEEDATSFVILSVIYQGNKLGAAYYNLDRCHLYLMTDHIDTPPSFSLLKLLLRQTEPSHIVTSQQMDENMLHVLREINNFGSATTESTNSAGDRNKLHLLPNIDFALEASKHRLQTLQLLNAPKNMNDFERKIHLSSLIDFTSSCMVKAAGGLLKFLDKNTFGLSLENSSSSVSGISALSLKNILNIDDNSYRALQIFQEERHPSVYKSTVGNKEGLSLYGICNRCKSAIGKKELKRWFLMPTNNPEIIKERQSAIKYFILSKNSDVLSALQGSLKHIKFLPRILTRMKTAQAAMTDWQALYKTSYHAMLICDIARSRTHCLEIFSEISNTFSTDLFRIASLLNKIIDFEEYAKQNHFVVKPGVDSELDKMKRTYNGLPNFMTEVAYQELQELSSDIPQCSVIYLPQLGYLLAIPATEQMKDTKDYSIPNLRFMFITNDVAHYKSDNTKKLDSLLGDTLCDIYDKETQIMHKLQNVILEMKPVLFDVMEYSAKLDCLIALSVVAKEYNWIQPDISMDGELAIVKGRHPLQEICVSSFVGNNVFSGGTESKIKVLTGPNSSGKSIYLKQVALLVYMGHLGSFIPAQKAKIPAFDNIFTCMNASESVSLNLSSFLISLNQLSYALNKASHMSLVIIDEFGKHTEAESGEALMIASLNFWMRKGSSSPHIFLATHFLNLSKPFADNSLIKFQTMDITIENDLVFLYQLVDGVASSSLASHTALRAGMPEECIKRSLQILEAFTAQEPISPHETHPVHDKLKRYFSVINEFLDLDIETNDVQRFLQFVKEMAQISQSPTTSSALSSKPRGDAYSS
ncbi:mutS protein homolog 5 isoform X1 [Parasteatoda tepidariorum]|uniref:mutS protein homolog 5 isoform X1 n=2 Tax=Parasteatoda tepidariorum TaxID=114398 RepID=UPI001C71D19B|nr:mutS protein homolog 5 isoform X1 [Parasteatoda tepidariorum]XP_042899006.1 mutS protein homolog 5 isoform X1 [Parasteatoda tepidariorum]XP_042899007.1 mutS protein homolog 5 isoform X1 [Parasteatoda tepidariorum]XP_042899008.1 mutS protein homolog 5 isoform X1 [Parasteatoda tepidariorum]XP_042899009.1 mutS protein homolog 5 isoform X1 [Parasteatoda tepidariorum]XP_042899010.1 mutS protein homolog 5 isoform X1 [Parasteatoda tepidariorum]XP_042899011.1 mutS protein homolog 5 isoform X1 [Par